MNFDYTDKVKDMRERLLAFMEEHIYPNEGRFFAEIAANRAQGNPWIPTTIIEELKPKARAAGLWNLFLPRSPRAPEGLSNLEYAPMCEIMGRVPFAAEVFNCSAPDTGNMETLERYASEALKDEWLEPLLRGEFRSAFLMTEPEVASSDATNIQCRIERDGDEYVINGRKWWSSGAGDPRCAVYIVMGKTNPDAARHSQQSMIVVPSGAKGVEVVRPLSVFGYDDAPHGHMEVDFIDVRVPASNMLLGEGRGFEIAQGRLGPGRIHHCMRLIGLAERTLEKMCVRTRNRVAFGKPVSEQTVTQERIDRFAEVLKALASPARLRIVNILARGERTVTELCERSGLKQSLVSQQLKQLRLSDVVQRRKDVPKVFYSLREKNVINVLNCLNSCGCCKAETRRNGNE